MRTISQVANIGICESFWSATHLGTFKELISRYYRHLPRFLLIAAYKCSIYSKILSIYLYSGYFNFYLLTLLWQVNIYTCHPNCNGGSAKPLTVRLNAIDYKLFMCVISHRCRWLVGGSALLICCIMLRTFARFFYCYNYKSIYLCTSESIHKNCVMENDKVRCHVKPGLRVTQDNTLSIFCVNSTRDIQIDRDDLRYTRHVRWIYQIYV